MADNSIDNRNKNRKVKIDISFEINGDEIRIRDDANAMDKRGIQKALTIAYHDDRKYDTIGENGFGLKSATSYLGKKVIIYTRKKNRKNIIKVEYIENEFIHNENWGILLEYITNNELCDEIGENLEYGTIIIIKDLNVRLYRALAIEDDKNGRLIPYLSRYYMLALENKAIITLNVKSKDRKGKLIENKIIIPPYEFPELICKCKFSFYIFDKNLKEKKKINGWIGIIDPRLQFNNKKNKNIYRYSGFFVAKNDKIILEKEKIGYNSHPETRLINGLLNVKDFTPTNSKDSFIKDEYWMILQEVMKMIFVKAAKKISTSSYIKTIRNNIINNVSTFDLNSIFKELIKQNIESIDDSKNTLLNRVDLIEYSIDMEVYNNYLTRMQNTLENLDDKKEIKTYKNLDAEKEIEDLNLGDKKEIENYLEEKSSIYEFYTNIFIARHNLKIKHSIEYLSGEFYYDWNYNKENNTMEIKSLLDESKFNLIKDKKLIIINNIENAVFDYLILNNEIINKNIILEMRKEIKKNLIFML